MVVCVCIREWRVLAFFRFYVLDFLLCIIMIIIIIIIIIIIMIMIIIFTENSMRYTLQ